MSYSNAVALQMPSSYVPMTSEEMEYLEGGNTVVSSTLVGTYVLSESKCNDIGLALTGVVALTPAKVKKLLPSAKAWVIDAILFVTGTVFLSASAKGGLRFDHYKERVYSARDGYYFDRFNTTMSFNG